MVDIAENAAREELHFPTPPGLSVFTRDPEEIRRVHAHFQDIISRARAKCAELGVAVEDTREWTGTMTVAAGRGQLDAFLSFMREEGMMLG